MPLENGAEALFLTPNIICRPRPNLHEPNAHNDIPCPLLKERTCAMRAPSCTLHRAVFECGNGRNPQNLFEIVSLCAGYRLRGEDPFLDPKVEQLLMTHAAPRLGGIRTMLGIWRRETDHAIQTLMRRQ